MGNFVLAIRREPPGRFKGFFEKFCHERKSSADQGKWEDGASEKRISCPFNSHRPMLI